MKKIVNISIFAFLAIAVLVTSCKKDDPPAQTTQNPENPENPTPDDNPFGSGTNIADGVYVVGTSTISKTKDSVPEEGTAQKFDQGIQGFKTESGAFSYVDRAGAFIKNVYLTTEGGLYFVQYSSQKIIKRWGVAFVDSIAPKSDDQRALATPYRTGPVVENSTDRGTVSETGWYQIYLDDSSKTAYATRIDTLSIIGAATPNGGSNATGDTDLERVGTESADGATWQVTDVTLRPGWMKFRYLNGWDIVPNNVGNPDYTPIADFKIPTNWGNLKQNPSLATLQPTGENIDITREQVGVYTIEFSINENGVASAELKKTGDAAPLAYPDYSWGIIGNAVGGWDTDRDLTLQTGSTTPNTFTYKIDNVVFSAGGEFKFRADNAWDVDFGGGQATVTGDAGTNVTNKGNNYLVGTEATYNVTITVTWDGNSGSATYAVLLENP